MEYFFSLLTPVSILSTDYLNYKNSQYEKSLNINIGSYKILEEINVAKEKIKLIDNKYFRNKFLSRLNIKEKEIKNSNELFCQKVKDAELIIENTSDINLKNDLIEQLALKIRIHKARLKNSIFAEDWDK